MSASWYDVLGVDPSATDDEIRAAWRASIADLDPTDRRFTLYNEAAGVLLDRDRRAAYDAEREPSADVPAAATGPADEPSDAEATGEAPAPTTPEADVPDPATRVDAEEPSHRRVPTWLLAALAMAVLLVGVPAAIMQFRGDDGAEAERAISQARESARKSVPQVFTYDYRYPERDFDRAMQVLTGDLRDDYEEIWKEAIEPNLTKVKGTATSRVIGTGAVRATDEGTRAEVLVIVSSETSNVKGSLQATNAFTVTMVEKDGEWLIEELEGFDTDRVADEPSEGSSPSPSPSPTPSQ